MTPTEVRTHREVAAFFRVREREVRRWKVAGCEALNDSPYDLGAVYRWRSQRAEDRGRPIGGSRPVSADRLRRAIAEADRAEVEVKLKRRQLEILERSWLSREQVEAEVATKFEAIRSVLSLLPNAIARETVTTTRQAERQAIMERHVDDALRVLASERFYVRLTRWRRRVAAAGDSWRLDELADHSITA